MSDIPLIVIFLLFVGCPSSFLNLKNAEIDLRDNKFGKAFEQKLEGRFVEVNLK